jgi:aerobic carbon-monoxide dehydrogenase medium subunit
MFPAQFDYHRASSVADVHRLLREHPGAKLLAGGHSLIPLLKLRFATPAVVIDIGRISDLKGITVSGETIRIGALTTHAELAASPELRRACPAIAEAAGMIGDPMVRNRGTIGGNVAHADPASDLPTVLVALGASFVAAGPRGERTIDASSFFQGLMTTELAEDEVLLAVTVPAGRAGQGAAYVKFSHPASRYAVVGAAAVIGVRGGSCLLASVALGGIVPRPVKAVSVEKALMGTALTPDAIRAAATQVSQDLGSHVMGDLFASAEYRRAIAPVYAARAIQAATERARL